MLDRACLTKGLSVTEYAINDPILAKGNWTDYRDRWQKETRRGVITPAEFDTQENCEIRIRPGQCDATTFRLQIAFHNTGQETIGCAFSLDAGRPKQFAALHSLSLVDAEGISPPVSDVILICPRMRLYEAPELEPDGWLTFELEGTLAGDQLDFGSCRYQIVPGKTYHLSFRYIFLQSNTITWTAP